MDQQLSNVLARLNARLQPSSQTYRPLIVDRHPIGRVCDAVAGELTRWPALFAVTPDHVELSSRLDSMANRTDALAEVVHALYREGLFTGWRNETCGVALRYGAELLFRIERAALRTFGLTLYAAHINGLSANGKSSGNSCGKDCDMWLARRSMSKQIDPGLLDALVGGGLSEGLGIAETLIKESWEEAGIDASISRQAVAAGAVRVSRPVDNGWHDEILFVHDLTLPAGFLPENKDGEVQQFTRLPLSEVLSLMSDTDDLTIEASIAICDFMIRTGFLHVGMPGYQQLRTLIRCV
jgi:8-oxo-dGTP pyrophosphatase MutT (NUDIX family)